ncbi:2OG-Fe(II) oxygenase [Sinomicrobium kalidii]|uniref:2OG-Fe(II) oxygenase n=1 Tax=Sinomicrobium kalidii TaxID=2900738 RepID=UPI001E64D42C|nr:2OG-Fe(II) oxygenase [Sinomicrobium kalidii]UGU16299.1 2OG-Fe(II) oxygenase [Sinomicrobium kalidii]
MEDIAQKTANCNWEEVTRNLNERGYAIIPGWLTEQQCHALINEYNGTTAYRKTVVMERYRFGLGEYKYYDYPLPRVIQAIRQNVYPRLVPVANLWMQVLRSEARFPGNHSELLAGCHEKGQLKPTPLILKYGKGGYNTLHQDLYGEVFFPLQAVCFLNEPGKDYEGGEFVLTEQVPRAQSRATVLRPEKGDMLIFTTNFRPEKGKRGYYRVRMKHGVSEVTRGERHTLGVIFHDAIS